MSLEEQNLNDADERLEDEKVSLEVSRTEERDRRDIVVVVEDDELAQTSRLMRTSQTGNNNASINGECRTPITMHAVSSFDTHVALMNRLRSRQAVTGADAWEDVSHPSGLLTTTAKTRTLPSS